MLKNKTFLIAFASILLIFYSNNISFSAEDIESGNKFPDFAYEFTGKDKCERFNRKLFIFNLKLNNYILRPVNIVWASIMPKYGMDRLQNAYNNINFPVRLVSCALQKDFKGSRQEALRFLTNTTIGVAGLYDPAKNKFKIEPREEDMGQVLAHYKTKQGPYLVLPIVKGNIRDLIGQLLDYPLKPLSYIPIAGGIATAVFNVNNTTYSQPLVKKIDETYADPYEIAREVDGISKYIKNENLDRDEVLRAKTASQNIIKIRNAYTPILKSDIELKDYNPQSPVIDSMRTSLFNYPEPHKSAWSELSVWNRTFEKKIKTSSINLDPKHPNYKYRYILQNKKNSPVAIIYPSIGEGIKSDHSNILAKILYDEGYSVIIQGSAFQWEFVKSLPDDYKPGFPYQDANYLRIATSKILHSLEQKKSYTFDKRIIVGSSLGALTGLFATAQDEKENLIGISKCIAINPPVKLLFALEQIDKISQEWKNDPSDIKMRTAITAEKVVQTYKQITDEKIKDKPNTLPFTDDEAKLIVGFIMKQKLSDVVFAIEKGSRGKKSNIYEVTNKMNFNDYGEKYIFHSQNKPMSQIDYESSLYYIANFLGTSQNYKIYHTLDDFFTSPEQLAWLKDQTREKTVLFSNGSHLGFLYRKEFLDEFKKDTSLKDVGIHKEL